MVTAQDLVDSSTRADLVDQAKDLGLDVKDSEGKPMNKPELAEAILAAEAEAVEAELGAEEAVEVESAVEEAPVEEDAPEADPVEKDEDDVLVRFIGKNPVLQTSGLAFKKTSPFKVLSADKAQELFDGRYGDKFRVATPKEAKEFYS